MGKETALPKNIRQIGEIQGEEKICLEDYVMTYIRKKEKQEKEGYLGVFLGEEQKTDDAVYVFIRGILEIPESDREEEQLLDGLKEKYQKYFPDWEVQGCCVIGRYPTDRMKEVCSLIPQAGRLIYHLQEQEENLYWTEEGRYKKMKGYFVFYEQNRKMQTYLADVFQDDSVEKESLSDKAIKTFREKVREKGERKSSGMLKIASSFFVITVLVIGAIAVTRMDDIRNLRNAVSQKENTVENEADDEKNQVSVNANVAEQVLRENQAAGGSSNETGEAERRTETAAGADAGAVVNEVPGSIAAEMDMGSDTSASSTEEVSGSSGAVASSADTAAGTADTAIGTADTASGTSEAAAGTSEATAGTAGTTKATASSADTASGTSEAAAGTAEATASSADTAAGTSEATAGTAEATTDTAATAADTVPSAGEGTPQAEETREASASARQTRAAYVIREGDTLADICSRYYGSLERIQDICTANGITDANMILPGQKIVLP